MKDYGVFNLKGDKSSSSLTESSDFVPLHSALVSLLIVISKQFLSCFIDYENHF
jgi:hypothetical protein